MVQEVYTISIHAANVAIIAAKTTMIPRNICAQIVPKKKRKNNPVEELPPEVQEAILGDKGDAEPGGH